MSSRGAAIVSTSRAKSTPSTTSSRRRSTSSCTRARLAHLRSKNSDDRLVKLRKGGRLFSVIQKQNEDNQEVCFAIDHAPPARLPPPRVELRPSRWTDREAEAVGAAARERALAKAQAAQEEGQRAVLVEARAQVGNRARHHSRRHAQGRGEAAAEERLAV